MKCITKYCKNKALKYRKLCAKCRSKQYKEKYPMHYFFNLLRGNAKRRGKEFKLTLDEFKQFCNDTGYLQQKGKTADSMSIDRIDPSKGYAIDNIRMITLSENAKLQHDLPEEYKQVDNCPF